MIPLVATQRELLYLRETLEEEIKRTFKGTGQSENIPIGTMIETPRAAITAERLGVYADFFSFGTNDLTQLTWAFSRDDVESSFLPRYLDLELVPCDPTSIHFFDRIGLDYVSCSPFRVPVARLESGRAVAMKANAKSAKESSTQ
jgi:pyruvate,orthophosphate dikinase